MKLTIKLLFSMAVVLLGTSCSKVVPPHTAIKCKISYDRCMVLNATKGPSRAHEICLAKRLPVCRDLPTP